jgi:2-oxoglutarate dehydrogenase E2 component (dihydrolipoamide succinyltransferase)
MPKMGESINEGTIIKWHKKIGDSVNQDEIIFEISTDKVDTEIPSPTSGVLKEIKFNEGDTVEVGKVVAVIDTNGYGVQQESASGIEEPQNNSEDEIEEPIAESEADYSSGETVTVEMPKMGESVMEGTIIKWYKKVGDRISKDETIFEISTDKVDTEIPSPVDGTLAEILIGEQETAEVGTVVAKITSGSGETRAAVAQEKTEIKEDAVAPKVMHDSFSKTVIPEIEKPKGDGGKFYSPLVLNIAQKENVSLDELQKINGTGLGGRVTKKDIINYIKDRSTTRTPAEKTIDKKEEIVAGAPVPSFTPYDTSSIPMSGNVEKIPMDNIRQKIMEHMVASRDTSVHVTSMIEIDMTRIHNFIQENKEQVQQREGIKLTYMAFIAQACVRAIKAHPLINSTLDGNAILQKNYVNLGIAVAIEPTGLIVPNIKGADQLNLFGLAKAVNELAYKSRNKKLTPDDISGGTFTITNYGVFGTVFGTPIINQPEVAILGVGAVIKKPVVINTDGSDAIAIRHMMALTLSHDHRLIDGMLGGLFLRHLKDTLENFDPGGII